MPGHRHSFFKHRMLAVFFLFLNVVCSASPVVKNNAEDHQLLISLPLGHDGNTSGLEENPALNSSFLNQHLQSCRLLKNHNCLRDFSEKGPAFSVHHESDFFITASKFLPIPGYYTFLFLCTLF